MNATGSWIRLLGSQLAEPGFRYAGLNPRSLARWSGTDRLSSLAALLPSLNARPLTPASTLLVSLVAGVDVPHGELGCYLDPLHQLELIDVTPEAARARNAVLPLGRSLLVCDRLDAADQPDLVCGPDDSSYHLALSLPPGRHDRWLDLGTGSGFAPLLRPDLATSVVAADLNPRALQFAKLGAELSGVKLTTIESDIGHGLPAELRGTCALVSCNAPIPDRTTDPNRPRWRTTHSDFVATMFGHAASFVTPAGIVVVHAALDALASVVAELPGERVIVAYTPPETCGFAVAWWRPAGDERHVSARRLLTEWRPHLTHEDRIAALAGTLPTL